MVYFPESEGWIEAEILDRAAMTIGELFSGPAVVEEPESTFVIGPGGRFHISAKGNLVIELPEAAA